MGRNSSGLHLEIARWILERGDAVSAYDVAKQFGVTIRQAVGLVSSIVTDKAMETQTGLIIPDRPDGRYKSQYVRSGRVLSVDHEIISRRRKMHRCHNYRTESYQQEKGGKMSHAEKWEWIIRHGRRQNK